MATLKRYGLTDHGSPDSDDANFLDSFFLVGSHAPSSSADHASGVNTASTASALTIEGTGGDDTLVVTAAGTDSGTYSLNGGPAVAFDHIASLTFNGGSGNDNMTVVNPDGGLFAPTNGIFVHGGTQNGGAGDGLTIVGGAQDTATYTTSAHYADGKDGSIVLSHGTVTATYTYTGLEPLANTGTATNVIFNLPAGADNAFLEDDGTPGNNTSQLRSGNGTFETTVFTNPTGSLTINSGAGDTVTVNLADALHGDLTIGNLTNSAVNPDSINVGNVVTTGRVTLAATGAIAESGTDAGADVTAGQFDLTAGTGIGVGNAIETAVGNLEAQTNTGGIFIANTGSNLAIGGQFGVSALTGLKVVTSGDINVTNAGTINLSDDDGPQTVLGGSVSGNVSLTATGATSDFLSGAEVKAIMAPAGGVTVQADRDIQFYTPGIGSDFDNDVRADSYVGLFAGRNLSIAGDADILSDAFGHNTSGNLQLNGGLGGAGGITISNVGSTGVDGGVSAGTGGHGTVYARTGFGGANVFTNQKNVFSTSGNIIIQSDSQDFQSGSSLNASQGTITLGITTSPVNADLGSTAAGFNFSQAELNTITAKVLTINPSANINISQSITLDPLKVPTLALEASFGGSGHAGEIIDGTATEQADLTVTNLLLQAVGSIGATDEIDVHVSKLAFDNYNPFADATPVVNISNTGPLTIGVVASVATSQNNGANTTITTTGPLAVATNVTSATQLVLQTIDSAASGENLTVLSGVKVQSNGNLFLLAGDNLDLQAGSTVQAPTSINLQVDVNDADPGVGATANVNGTLLAQTAGVGGWSDSDTFKITPSAATQIFVGALGPGTKPGDTLTVNTAGTTNAALHFGIISGNSLYGEYDFDNRQLVNFTDIETLNTINGPLTVNGTSLNDTMAVNTTGHNTGSFTLAGPYLYIFTTGDDSATPVSPFGVTDTATYGQVITADATHSKLSGFTFQMNLPSTVAFRGEVYAWDGTKAVGPALFESAVMSTSGTGMQDITFNAGDISLTPGHQYVLFASTSEDQTGHSGLGSWEATSSNVYSGGGFVFLNNGNDPSQWTTHAWSVGSTSGLPDLAFRAQFDQTATANFSNLTYLAFNGMGGHDTYSAAANINTVFDFDGNGQSDILWQNNNGAVAIWDNGQISGGHVTANAGIIPGSWHITGTGDFDGNGHNDVLWQNDNGMVAIWDNGQLADARLTANAGLVPNSWHITGTGDFDGNGRDDILWQNDNGMVAIWDNGELAGARIAADAGLVPNSWHIAGTGDFDGNGHDDILWKNDNGSVAIWDNGQVSGGHVTANPGAIPNGWHIAGTGDFDGNGHSDILWQNDNGSLAIWDNGQLGTAHLVADPGLIPNSWHITGIADYDRNGHSDILLQNDNGSIAIWDNGQANGAHITVNPGVIPSDWHIV